MNPRNNAGAMAAAARRAAAGLLGRAINSLHSSRRVFAQSPGGGGGAAAAGDAYARPRKTGIAHSSFTHGNVFVSITDFVGNAKAVASAGMVGFSGSRRDSKYAANAVAEHVARAASQLGIKSVEVRIKGGFGVGKRKYLLRGFKQGGLNVSKIRDVTQVPHNGCRPPKKRRV